MAFAALPPHTFVFLLRYFHRLQEFQDHEYKGTPGATCGGTDELDPLRMLTASAHNAENAMQLHEAHDL
jgi:hypothetical protein